MRHRTDLAIVGGGPAGAWAAYTAARQGARVAVFDASHPREKPCGGGITARAMALVADALDVAPPSSRIARARFMDDSTGQSATIPLVQSATRPSDGTGTRPLVVASRAVFDQALVHAAEDAGAALVRARVTDVMVDGSGVRLQTTDGSWRADTVIGADGANSLVRRRLARPFTRSELSIATGFFAHGTTNDEIAITLTSRPSGYIWSFPRPDHLAIGICAQADEGITASELRTRTADWIARTGVGRGARLEAYSWPIPSLPVSSLSRLTCEGPHWYLAGDAAGLVDPMTREGIYFALLSGEWAANAALARIPGAYTAQLQRSIIPELTRAARLKAGFFKPAFTDLLMKALQHSPAIGRVMADLIAGEQPYNTLKWRLIRTWEWRLAWRALAGSLGD